jgi:hypothetical protein
MYILRVELHAFQTHISSVTLTYLAPYIFERKEIKRVSFPIHVFPSFMLFVIIKQMETNALELPGSAYVSKRLC